MTYYTFPTYIHRERLEYVGQNKKRAIESARKRAIAIKQSVTITANHEGKWTQIAIAEFPYYLRELNLDPRDIKINYFE